MPARSSSSASLGRRVAPSALREARIETPQARPHHQRADHDPAPRPRAWVVVGGPCFAGSMTRVVVGALVREGRVLLVHRRPDKHVHPDRWDVPGGVMEVGESELEALERELREELGVQITAGAASHLCRLTVGPVDDRATLSAWLVPEWDGTPENAAPEEHDDLRWFDLGELPPPPHVIVREALLDAVADHS